MKNVSLIHITPLVMSLFVLFCRPVPASDLEQVKTSDQKQDNKAFYKGHWYSCIDTILDYLHYDISVETTTKSWKLLATYNPDKSHRFGKNNSREKLSKTVKYLNFYFQQNLDGSRLTAFPNTDYNPRIEAFYLNKHIVNQEKYLDISKSVMAFLAGAGNTPNDTVIIFDAPGNQFPAECQFIIQQIGKFTDISKEYIPQKFDDQGRNLPFDALMNPTCSTHENQNIQALFSGIRGKIFSKHGDIFMGLYQRNNDHVFIVTRTFLPRNNLDHASTLQYKNGKAQTSFTLELPDSPGESIDESLKQILENPGYKHYVIHSSGNSGKATIKNYDAKSVLNFLF